MNVLSLFDGISCGQIALNNLGVKLKNYYASEIKKHAISITMENFPNTIQVGDVTKLKATDLPEIDLLIGGSPCQDLSQAHKTRDGLEGEKSSLFFQYVRLLNECKPRHFFLENVSMRKEDQDMISSYLGVEPIKINSSLLSAQLRNRLYWTNIPQLCEPHDHYIKLQSVLTEGWTDREKSRCLLESDSRPLSTPVKMFHRYFSSGFTTLVFRSEDHYLRCKTHYTHNYMDGKKSKGAKYIDEVMGTVDNSVYDGIRYFNKTELQRLQGVPYGYTHSATRNQSACTLGDAWNIPTIEHLFSYFALR